MNTDKPTASVIITLKEHLVNDASPGVVTFAGIYANLVSPTC